MPQLWRSRVLRDEDEPGLVGAPTSDWRACSLAWSARVGSIGTRAAGLQTSQDFGICGSAETCERCPAGLIVRVWICPCLIWRV